MWGAVQVGARSNQHQHGWTQRNINVECGWEPTANDAAGETGGWGAALRQREQVGRP